jgi:ribosomal protein L11
VPFSQTSIKPNKHNGVLSIDHVREIERQKKEQIVSNTWEEKEQIRFNQCNAPFT